MLDNAARVLQSTHYPKLLWEKVNYNCTPQQWLFWLLLYAGLFGDAQEACCQADKTCHAQTLFHHVLRSIDISSNSICCTMQLSATHQRQEDGQGVCICVSVCAMDSGDEDVDESEEDDEA